MPLKNVNSHLYARTDIFRAVRDFEKSDGRVNMSCDVECSSVARYGWELLIGVQCLYVCSGWECGE